MWTKHTSFPSACAKEEESVTYRKKLISHNRNNRASWYCFHTNVLSFCIYLGSSSALRFALRYEMGIRFAVRYETVSVSGIYVRFETETGLVVSVSGGGGGGGGRSTKIPIHLRPETWQGIDA